ncbi:MAG: DUF4416 family protein [Chrysiogenales bacterium]
MGKINEFKKVKLFCGLIFSQSAVAEKAKVILGEHLSSIDSQSAVIPFAMTDYYQLEMGAPLFRQFVSFGELLPPEKLPEIKIFTNGLEKQMAGAGKRIINIDPGFMSDANVIIATSKNHYHRVPLNNGIYAHLEYVLKNKQLSFLPWTYPDFQTESYLVFFRQLFILFKQNSRNIAR